MYYFHMFRLIFDCRHLTGLLRTNRMTSSPVGLLAQLVENCIGIAEVMGLTHVQAWIFQVHDLFSLLS